MHPDSQREFFLIHSEKVVEIWKILASYFDKDTTLFEIAGRIHDIGYAKDIDHHASESFTMLQELWYAIDPILEDCILNHGSSKTPTTFEGKLFQIADKLSIFDVQMVQLLITYGEFPFTPDDQEFLKSMSQGALSLIALLDTK
jgi:predicted hydrolase (HD superfamily)